MCDTATNGVGVEHRRGLRTRTSVNKGLPREGGMSKWGSLQEEKVEHLLSKSGAVEEV